MLKNLLLFSTLVLLIVNANATVITIVNSGFTFSPSEVTITEGDSIQFTVGGAHQIREVNQATWDANGNTALAGGFETALGGGLVLPANLTVGTHYYVCIPHASMGMKGKIIVDPSTSKISENTEKLFSIYPNPTSNGIFEIYLSNSTNLENVSLKIFNIQGEIVYHSSILNNSTRVELTDKTPGLYFVQLNMNGTIITRKLIVTQL